jgi:hypothetical protein
MAFLRINSPRDAWDEQKKLLDYELSNLSNQLSLAQASQTLALMLQFSVPIKRVPETLEACAKAEALVTPISDAAKSGPARLALTNLRIVKAEALTQLGKADEGRAVLASERIQLTELMAAEPANEVVRTMYLRNLTQLAARTVDPVEQEAIFSEQQGVLQDALASRPDDPVLVRALLTVLSSRLQSLVERDESTGQATQIRDTIKAMELVDIARSTLDRLQKANPAVEKELEPFRAGIAQWESRVNNQLRLPELIGSAAAPLTAAVWINGNPLPAEDWKGKVILLDVWAAFIEPTPAVFAFCKSLNEKYREEGLQIIGVTRYFNVRWDFTAEAPRLVRDRVPADEEKDALQLFLEKQKVDWPTMIVDDPKQLQENYAVSQLPFSVVIDRKGNIRMLKAGFGKGAGAEIESLIEELLKEKN